MVNMHRQPVAHRAGKVVEHQQVNDEVAALRHGRLREPAPAAHALQAGAGQVDRGAVAGGGALRRPVLHPQAARPNPASAGKNMQFIAGGRFPAMHRSGHHQAGALHVEGAVHR